MAKKKTTGTDDLIKTLIKQHGLEKAISAARHQMWWVGLGNPNSSIRDHYRLILWRNVHNRLKDMR